MHHAAVSSTGSPPPAPAAGARRFGRGARLVLACALALVLLSCLQKAYRLTLPTDGWSTTTDFESDAPIFLANLLAAPSELRPGDRLVAVEGVRFDETELRSLRGERNTIRYEAGGAVRYTVLRDGAEIDVAVPLVPGTRIGAAALLRGLVVDNQVADLFFLLGIALTVFLFWKRPDHPTTRLLLLMTAASVASAVSWTVTPLSVADTLHPGTLLLASLFSHWIHLLLEQPLGLHVILSFPRPSPLLRRRWVLPTIYGLPAAVLVILLAFPAVPVALAFLVVALTNLIGIGLVVRMVLVRRGPVETAQVRWFGLGFFFSNTGFVLFGLSLLGLFPERWLEVSARVPYGLLFLGCIAIALLRYRLFDIDVILSRTLVWGGLTAGVVGIYALVVTGMERLLQPRIDLFPSLLATGLVAVAFAPMRTRLQRSVNRLLYGDRHDPFRVLSDLSQRLGTALDPSAVLPTMADTIARALKLPYVGVALELAGEDRVVAEAGRPRGEALTLPLVYQAERVGELRLEPRGSEERFGATELALLRAIARQASVVAYALRLTDDLQRSRVHLVTAREEERRRLRRDLHDGLGPTLAGIAMKLDAARNLARSDPDAAEALLTELKRQAQETLADVRRLVYALRPPALDELGLAGALEELARQHEGSGPAFHVDLPARLPPLPAAVEVAAYRIAQEALANALRHADARQIRLRLQLAEGLELEIRDDGVGLPTGRRAGVGLTSMRERAEELGGSLALESGPGRGTIVRARLPLTQPERDRASNG